MKLQDKINISDIFINDYLRLIGNVQVFGMNINIETELSFSKVEHNNIYLNIKSFKLLKMNIVNPISKKIFNYVINAFTDIEGVTFEGNDFKLEVATLVNKYYKEQKFIDLNRVQVIDVSIQILYQATGCFKHTYPCRWFHQDHREDLASIYPP